MASPSVLFPIRRPQDPQASLYGAQNTTRRQYGVHVSLPELLGIDLEPQKDRPMADGFPGGSPYGCRKLCPRSVSPPGILKIC